MVKAIRDFIIHLRLHYQVGILSAAYLLALLYRPGGNMTVYWTQFINVHVLLFGGATAFNSYWDRDEGPVGGLKQPPPVRSGMRWGALLLMLTGLVWASRVGIQFTILYAFSAFLFWGYSSPLVRWKGKPWQSVVVIALSTGTNAFLMGCLAAESSDLFVHEYIASIGVGLMLVSLYPASQIFQKEVDRSRGDNTFAMRYGIKGIRRFFTTSYLLGALSLSYSLSRLNYQLAVVFLALSGTVAAGIYYRLKQLKGKEKEYQKVMNLKYSTSISFVVFILLTWLIAY